MVRDIEPTELAKVLGTEQQPFLLDVREPDEVREWSIPGAHNVPLGELSWRYTEVPKDRPIVAYCAAGGRSKQAADALDRAGYDVANLAGGIAAWGTVYDAVDVAAGTATVVQMRRRGKGCLSYVVGAGEEAFVVDPSMDTDRYVDLAAERGWSISRVFDTHLHADHLSGARALAERTGAVLHLNPADSFSFSFEPLVDGQRFGLGGEAEMEVSAVRTPGHTEGSTIYVVSSKVVLTGDTLFVDGVGRPDLAEKAEEFARNLHRSLRERVLTMDDDTLVLPAHYGATVAVRPSEPVGATLRDLREALPPLQMDEDEFVAWAAARTTPRPPNYVEIVKANMGRSDLPMEALVRLESGPNRCSA